MRRVLVLVAVLGFVTAACAPASGPAEPPAETTAETTAEPPGDGPLLTVEGFAFGQVPSIAPGGSFEIVNNDSGRHTFTSNNDSWESLDLPPGETVTFTAPAGLAPGEYSFFCAVHPDSMGGRLTVSG